MYLYIQIYRSTDLHLVIMKMLILIDRYSRIYSTDKTKYKLIMTKAQLCEHIFCVLTMNLVIKIIHMPLCLRESTIYWRAT